MKPAQLEILVFTDTMFLSKEFSEKDHKGYKNNFPPYKGLEEASWNGLFEEMLPELYGEDRRLKNLFLWQVIHGEHFLELEYGEHPNPFARNFSVNPYFFMATQSLS